MIRTRKRELFSTIFILIILLSFIFLSLFEPSQCYAKVTWEYDGVLNNFSESGYIFDLNKINNTLLDENVSIIYPVNTEPYLYIDKLDRNNSAARQNEMYVNEIVLANKGGVSFYDVVLVDVVPKGFSFIKGSPTIDGVTIPDPILINGQYLFKIGDFPSYTKKIISYRIKTINNTIDGNYYNLTYAKGKYINQKTQQIMSYESKIDVSDVWIASDKYYSSKAGSEVLGTHFVKKTVFTQIVLVIAGISFVLILSSMRKNKYFKNIFAISFLFILLYVFPDSVKAVSDTVYLMDLPQYTNTNNFKLSYVAVSDSKVTAKYYVRKDTDLIWHNFAWTTGYSGSVDISEPSVIYSGDGKYIFKVEINGSKVSDESETIIDRSIPYPVTMFVREITNTGTYLLHWKNPNISDIEKILIYRSTQKRFNADNSSVVGEVEGEKEAEVLWEDVTSDNTLKYYYCLRVIDKAGNASGLVCNVDATTVAGEAASISNTLIDSVPQDKDMASKDTIENNKQEMEEVRSSQTLITYTILVICVILYGLYEYKKSMDISNKSPKDR